MREDETRRRNTEEGKEPDQASLRALSAAAALLELLPHEFLQRGDHFLLHGLSTRHFVLELFLLGLQIAALLLQLAQDMSAAAQPRLQQAGGLLHVVHGREGETIACVRPLQFAKEKENRATSQS